MRDEIEKIARRIKEDYTSLTLAELTTISKAYPELIRLYFEEASKDLARPPTDTVNINTPPVSTLANHEYVKPPLYELKHLNNMRDKYFTPQIEDIRVGYECELKYLNGGWTKFIIKDTWVGRDGEGDLMEVYGAIEGTNPIPIRVPYLTKEQIEADGWDLLEDYIRDIHWYKFQKVPKVGNPVILHYNDQNWILLHQTALRNELTPQYSGECKDVNTFRYICKLLGISK